MGGLGLSWVSTVHRIKDGDGMSKHIQLQKTEDVLPSLAQESARALGLNWAGQYSACMN